jgi:DNA repair protein SbcC/Rad50
MKLRSLIVNRLPGIDHQFRITEIDGGIQILHGPNGIGKSSIAKAIESIFWEKASNEHSVLATATFSEGSSTWTGDREGSRIFWKKDGSASTPPPLPGSHLSHCFFLRLSDMLNATDRGAGEFAEGIQRQLSGGYDTVSVKEELFPRIRNNHGSRQFKIYGDKTQEIDRAEGSQENLRLREDKLGELEQEIIATDDAANRLDDVQMALELVTHRNDLANIEVLISDLPDGIEILSGDETVNIDELSSQIDDLLDEKQGHISERDLALEQRQETSLDAEIDAVDLNDWRDDEKELIAIENRLVSLEEEVETQNAKVLDAQKSVGRSGEELRDDIDVPQTRSLLEYLDKAQNLDREIKNLNETIEFLEELGAKDDRDESESLPKLISARTSLLNWLRSAPPPKDSSKPFSVGVRIAGAILAAVGAALVMVDPIFGLPAIALGLGLIVATFVKPRPTLQPDVRSDVQNKYPQLGVEPPIGWNESDVEVRIAEIDENIGKQTAKSERDRDRDGDRRKALFDLKELESQRKEIEDEREALFAALEITDDSFDPGIVDLLRSMDELRNESRKLAEVKRKQELARGQYDDLIKRLNEIFSTHGIASDAKNCAGVGARLQELTNKNTNYRDANSSSNVASRAIKRVEGEIEGLNGKRDKIYVNAGVAVGDDLALGKKIETLPNYKDLVSNVQKFRPLISEKNEKLEHGKSKDLLDLTEEGLNLEAEKLKKITETADELKERRTNLTRDLEEAKSGNDVEELIHEQELAMQELDASRQEALKSIAGDFLMTMIEDEHEKTQTPRVFNRAMELFADFTDHNYELKLPTDPNNPELRAVDTQSNEVKSLDSLSDGTRTQLLLAAKVAYAEDVEQGVSLPLFLDETLVQSDPDRFENIIVNLGKVANDSGRQIFYITSDPYDISRIKHILEAKGFPQPGTIDVAKARQIDQLISNSSELEFIPPETLPEPEGMLAEDYAIALHVDRFAPRTGADPQHLYYLIRDDLETLHRLAKARITSVGQWRRLSETPSAETICGSAGSVEMLNRRIDVLDEFCLAWSRGRGKPIDRSVLEASKAFSNNNIDAATDLCKKYGGDASAFMNALENSELPRFQTRKREALEEYLTDNGYIDRAECLDLDEIIRSLHSTSIGSTMQEYILSEVLYWHALAEAH